MRARIVHSAEVSLAAVQTGDLAGPTVLLVHGYPDTKELWSEVVARLPAQLHVVAYDVRGAGESSRPRGAAAYDLSRLGDDLLAVAAELSPGKRVHLVGHDWGAIAAWEFAADPRFDGVLASVSAVAGPSLDQVSVGLRALVRERRLLEALRRLKRSYYIALLWLPGGPTVIWRVLLGVRRWRWLLEHREGVPVPAGYPRSSLPRDGICGANLYRRNIPRRTRRPRPRRAHVPIQVIVPTGDRFIPVEHYARICSGTRRHELPGSHWAPLAAPALLAELIAEFVADVEAKA